MDHGESHQVEEYKPGTFFKTLFWTMAVAVVSTGISISFSHKYEESSGSLWWLWFGATLIAALVGPPAIQYALLRNFGNRPSWTKWIERNDSYRLLFWKPGSYKFTPN